MSYVFTDEFGTPLTWTPEVETTPTLLASDARHLPLWLEAARVADDREYCQVYDEIARTVGGPTREDLRQAGLLQSKFTVTGYRRVTTTVLIPFEVEVTSVRPGDIRRDESLIEDELGEVDAYAVRSASYDSIEFESVELTIDSIERE